MARSRKAVGCHGHSSHLLERRNNDQIVLGGAMTQRLVKRQEVERGIKKKAKLTPARDVMDGNLIEVLDQTGCIAEG